jgi:hypothetical protein
MGQKQPTFSRLVRMDLPDENAFARSMRNVSENAEDVHVEHGSRFQASSLFTALARVRSFIDSEHDYMSLGRT